MPRKNEIDYLEEIAAKTGSATITGPVTVTNEVEIKNSENSPIPVSDNNSSLTVDGTVELGATSLAALENISVTFPSSQNVSVQNASLAVTGTFWQATQPVSLATAPTTPVTGTFWQATQPISGTVTANNQSLTTGSGTLPGTSAVGTDIISSIDVSGFSEIMVQFTDFPMVGLAQFQVSNDNSTFVTQAALPLSGSLSSPVQNIGSAGFYKLALAGARYFRLRVAGSGMSGTWAYSYTLNPRSSSNFGQLVFATTLPLPTGASSETTLSSVNTKIPSNLTVSSTRLLVDGSGVTQPTRETQPIDDYIINTGSVTVLSSSGSAVQSASFDAGANADYVVISLTGAGASGALYYDLSTNNSTWDAGNLSNGFSTYYDLPATSTTDAYSYKNVTATSLFGGSRSVYSGRFIVPLQQATPGSSTQNSYRYIRLNIPAGASGGWRYRFTSYKSVDPLMAFSLPGNPSTRRVVGRVDVGVVSTLPSLPTGSNTIGSVNVLGGNTTAVKVDIAPGTATENIVTGNSSATANTSVSVLAARANRKYLVIQNLSDTNMNLNFGAAASASTMLLPANGGGVSFEGTYVPASSLNLVCSAASKPYYILEAYTS